MGIFDGGKKRRELEAALEKQRNEIESMHEAKARSIAENKKARQLRQFQGAAFDRLVAGWVASNTSVDAEIRSSLPRLRQRSRQLGRDNDYAKSAFRTIRVNVVGQGVGFQSQVMAQAGRNRGKLDDKTNSAIEMAWSRWCQRQNCDVAGKLGFNDVLRMIMHSVPESGELIVREIYQRRGNSKVPLALEVVESDLLDDMYNGVADLTGNEIRMGVEIDQWSKPVAYYFRTVHPGDFQVRLPDNVRRESRIRVPASEIHHLFVPDGRAKQTRGVPWLASAIMRLHQMQGTEEAEVIAARAAASMMGFIQSPEEDTMTEGEIDGEPITNFEPGVIKKLGPGETFNVPNIQRPGGQFDPFMRIMLRGVAAGVGMSYESLSKDYSQSNYSSSRLALLDDRENWKVIQCWLIDHFIQPVFEKWLDLAVLSGEVSISGYEMNDLPFKSPKWKPRGWSWIDPAKEVAAYRDAVRSGFMTQSEVISQTSGSDFDDLVMHRKRELDIAKENELVFDTDPGQVNIHGQTQPADPLTTEDPKAPAPKPGA